MRSFRSNMGSFGSATKIRKHDKIPSTVLRFRVFVAALIVSRIGLATIAGQSPTYKLGRTPTADEIKTWDIAIGPDGKELPPGRGTVERGKVVYAEQCTRCHGATAVEGPEAP